MTDATRCGKCGYIRQPTDTAPDWQCPSCGVAYAKAGRGATRGDIERARRQRIEQADRMLRADRTATRRELAAARRANRKPASFADFAAFRVMVTPSLIRALFWIGTIVLFVGGLVTASEGGQMIYVGLMVSIFGPVFWRLGCEGMIIFFRIHEALAEIRDELRGD
jgi:hypothetical protein